MSRTYDIACKDCNVGLWIGQGWEPRPGEEDKRHLYTTEKASKALRDFLFEHLGHHLEFNDDEILEGASIDYKEISEEEPGEHENI